MEPAIPREWEILEHRAEVNEKYEMLDAEFNAGDDSTDYEELLTRITSAKERFSQHGLTDTEMAAWDALETSVRDLT